MDMNSNKLKGKDKLNHILGLMNKIENINEGATKIPSIKISKKAPNGKVYAIIRENQTFYIKEADYKENLSLKDFNYIGGLANKHKYGYPTYLKADKVLNNKLISIYEAYDIKTDIDTFHSDRLVKEEIEALGECNSSEEEITETEDMESLEKSDEIDISDDADLGGDFEEDPEMPDILKENVNKKPSILQAIKSDNPVLPEGYMDLIYKKKSLN